MHKWIRAHFGRFHSIIHGHGGDVTGRNNADRIYIGESLFERVLMKVKPTTTVNQITALVV